jgi:hypothetical protein
MSNPIAPGRPKNIQREVAVHPSTTGSQLRGNSHAARSHENPAQPVNANPSGGKPTPRPGLAHGAHAALTHVTGTGHAPENGDKILSEGMDRCNNALPGELHHSIVGKKGC